MNPLPELPLADSLLDRHGERRSDADWLARLSLTRNYRVTWRGSRAVGGLVVAYILCSSCYRAWRGKPVAWRGRSYAAGSGSAG